MSDLDALADAFGILPSFRDLSGTTQPTSPDTQRSLLRANGLVLDNEVMVLEALVETRAQVAQRVHPREIIVTSGVQFTLPLTKDSEWRLVLEGDSVAASEGRNAEGIHLPPIPSGVHTLTVTQGAQTESITVIAAPDRCPSIDELTGQARLWGVNAALYAIRSARNRGLGDFEDLASAAETFGAHGADFLGINPVHSIGWSERDTISPYSPTHRGFLNISHIALDRNRGALELASARGNAAERIEYPSFVREHQEILENLYGVFVTQADADSHSAFSDFCASRGKALSTFALYEVLSEQHGSDWHGWPTALQNSQTNEALVAQREISERIQFHQWLQWLADTQLSGAQTRAKQSGMGLGLYLDLAVGPRRGAAESWCERDTVAQDVALGAPPDHLSPDGQNWQLAAYAPAKLSRQNYGPLRRIIAETMRHAGILRIDHVLGMNRSYWIPDDGSPGGYIRQPFESLLAIIAIEAERAGTVVIGEDLGLVPEGFREAIGARGLYSYSVLQYERGDDGVLRSPDALRPNSLLCFGTHDTPTLKGFWSGCDIDWWRKLDWIDDDAAAKARKLREEDKQTLGRLGKPAVPMSEQPSFDDVKRQVHQAMATSPVAMVSVQLDDLCEQVEAQNLPGTIDEHPNWRRRCAVPLEDFNGALGLTELGELMRRAGRGAPTKKEMP